MKRAWNHALNTAARFLIALEGGESSLTVTVDPYGWTSLSVRGRIMHRQRWADPEGRAFDIVQEWVGGAEWLGGSVDDSDRRMAERARQIAGVR
jgi:hypothetical protein